MEYLKLWNNKLASLRDCSLEEKGWILEACIAYQEEGREIEIPSAMDGRFLRLLWKDFREMLDANRRKSEINQQNGSQGGRPRNDAEKPTENPAETEAKPSENPAETEGKPTEPKKQETRTGDKQGEPIPLSPFATGIAFDLFWQAYPKRQDKKKAREAFERLKPDRALLDTILSAIESQRASPQWQKEGGRFIPLPSVWLRGRRWEDELTVPGTFAPGKTVSIQQYAQRPYTEAQLLAVSDDLVEEARRHARAMEG